MVKPNKDRYEQHKHALMCKYALAVLPDCTCLAAPSSSDLHSITADRLCVPIG